MKFFLQQPKILILEQYININITSSKKTKMYNKMMLPIQLTKILYSDWQGTISVSSQDSQIYGKCLNGPGSVTFKNGNRYEGNFYNGLLNGNGKFTWANGIAYEGQFTDNRITGKGVYKWPDGSVYEGDVKDGLRHGTGVYKIDEATYEGEWKQGKKEGKGKIVFKSGSIFEGNFKNDLKHGYGKMYYYPSGNYFEGNWQNDMKEGQGTMNWTDLRQKYFGQWHNNYQHGWGVHIWLESKGEGKYLRNRYQGNWANGVRDGYGVFYYANGSKYEGYWKDNMKQGYSFYTNQNGKISHLLFDKDRMLKSGTNPNFDETSTKKLTTTNKKQVQPNSFSQCLQIEYLFYPFKPNLEALFNLLLRNNTQLKYWYKGLSNFYDQQSQFSFCLNAEGIWKMIRALKILGDISLAAVDRGMRVLVPKVQQILKLIQGHNDSIDYEDIFYKRLAETTKSVDFKSPSSSQPSSQQTPFQNLVTHSRTRNFLFRQFVHLLILIAYSLSPNIEKPQKSVEQFLSKITPMLETISKSIKSGTSDNLSENLSSVSKGEKNISPFFRGVNKEALQAIQSGLNGGKERGRLMEVDVTIRVREFIAVGRQSGLIGEQEYALLERIVEKYMDPQILNRPKQQLYSNSSLPPRILNILSYELTQYQFTQILYFLLIKKLPSHKQTEQTKSKYQNLLTTLTSPLVAHKKAQQQLQQYINQPRFLVSKKSKRKQILLKEREKMQKNKKEQQQRLRMLDREQIEREMMGREDKDVKEEEFEEEESQLDI